MSQNDSASSSEPTAGWLIAVAISRIFDDGISLGELAQAIDAALKAYR